LASTGCVEPTITGKHYGHTNCMLLNMVAPMEMALNNGVHPVMGEKIGPETGEVSTAFETYEDYLRAYKTQLKYLIDQSVEINNFLGYAHQYIVHRDVSPENILISHQGVTKLMDFGISVAADEEAFGFAGKIQYMAPEQVRSESVDNRSDIFALGLVAYHLLTGISLFLTPKGLDFREQATHYEQLLTKEIIPPHEVCEDIPEAYSNIIMKMLALAPEDRYQKIDKVGSDIEKKYIYARGFGPTNNSLAAYLKIFESDFQNHTREDLQQLAFMVKSDDTSHLKRTLRKELYSERGQKFIQARRTGP